MRHCPNIDTTEYHHPRMILLSFIKICVVSSGHSVRGQGERQVLRSDGKREAPPYIERYCARQQYCEQFMDSLRNLRIGMALD